MTVTYLHSDLEGRARRLLLPEIFDYFAGGASAELTMRRNRTAWSNFSLVPRLDAEIQHHDARIPLLGGMRPSPLLISPMARLDLLGSGDERDAAVAAGLCGVSFTASTRSSVRASVIAECFRDTAQHRRVLKQLSPYHRELYEELHDDQAGEPAFLVQLYLLASTELTALLVDEAARSELDALVVTLDTPVLGVRMRDLRRGYRIGAGALEELAQSAGDVKGLGDSWWRDSRQSTSVSIQTLKALVGEIQVPVFAKGVLASSALSYVRRWGGSGIWISNHGGRQLDHVQSTADALAWQMQPGESRSPFEVIVDGGVESAHAVIVAGCLGASGVGLGRSAAWALVLGGSAGLASYLLELRLEMKRSLSLLGVASYGALGPEYLATPLCARHTDVDE